MTPTIDRYIESIKALTSRRVKLADAKQGSLAIDELLRRAQNVITADNTGTVTNDGYAATTPLNGSPGGGQSGRSTMTIQDDDNPDAPPDHVPTSSTERAAFAGRQADAVADIANEITRSLRALELHLHTLNNACDRFDRLRKLDPENTDYCSVARQHELPWDYDWLVHRTTDFRGALTEPWPQPRRVSRFVYDFTRAQKRLPTKNEMIEYLRRGSVKLRAS